ncbi:ketoacyl-synt-domain-containing protein [Aspergillus neoniger CBS 115656]|uniref:Ketoacyl-synt-domain-containing protein n=1 Tax=Aspergillus neoniger (strain CBS 115656) TaxID=1448310 RepID=A0A318Z6W9_ASPNB|nr:ketoacyl-synt-domain-containing protein [Aspergillus neoniger CBS 115656]PYH39460.1 ketoacyl-synt-domain-containing protein [Aspergillus neoniger CBS 115656]
MDFKDSPAPALSVQLPNEPVTHGKTDSPLEPIAIVGFGLRLPGAIHTGEELWKLITEKRSTRSKIPQSRFNVNGFYSPTGRAGSVTMKHGHFLAESDNLKYFDTSFFSMSPKEADDVDPQQRMLLEVVYECMQSSGQVNWRGSKIGCYVGVWGEDWLDLHAKDIQDAGMFRVLGGHDLSLSNRISYEYDLKGPSFTIKAGCSSSLIALHEAIRAIRAGDCSGALVAGTNLIFSPTMSIATAEQGTLSPDGSCKSFDVAANGYARGEAINVIYVKSLGEAIKIGDAIRAVIRATATNFDGGTPRMATPSSDAHEALVRQAYREVSLNPKQTVFVEAHGTGTPDPVYIGSVKPNLGHSEGACGVSSVVKVILALENMRIPANINFSIPNSKIPFKEANMEVPVDVMKWPSNKPLRASVNSFGIAGANAHVILESVTPSMSQNTTPNADSQDPKAIRGSLKSLPHPRKFIHVISAAHPVSLTQSLLEHERYIRCNPSLMAEISYTLCNRREHLANRVYCVTSTSHDALVFSRLTKIKEKPTITMAFPGQGSQWAGMAKELIIDYPSFDEDITDMSAVLARLEHAPSWNLRDELLGPERTSNLTKSEYSQPLVTAVQVALVNLLRQWGIRPDAVVGHSSGEIAAAYASRAITAGEAITIAYYRGYLTKGYPRPGGMATIGLGYKEVARYLTQGIVIACENSPQSITLSGDLGVLEKACEAIKRDNPGCFVRRLNVEMGYHSHHILDIGEFIESFLCQHVHSKVPVVPFFSSVYEKRIEGPGRLDAGYWRENAEKPVLFYGAVKHLRDSEGSTEHLFLEMGPHSALKGPLRQISQEANRFKDIYLAAMTKGKDCTESILHMVGELYLNNVSLDFQKICPARRLLTNLPLYQWHHEHEYWSESRMCKEWRSRKIPHHELLGSRTLEGNDLRPEWRNMLRLEDVPWLRDHRIINDTVFPCAGYLAMAVEAMRQISSDDRCTFRDVMVHTALILNESKTVEMITNLHPIRLITMLDSDWWEFSIISFNETAWIKHCVGQIRAGGTHPTSIPPSSQYPRSANGLYAMMKKIGLNYGPCFRGLTGVTCLPGKNVASARLVATTVSEPPYVVHPTTIDHCLQLLVPASCGGIYRRMSHLCVPTRIEQIYISGSRSSTDAVVEAAATTSSTSAISGKVVAKSEKGIFLSLAGVRYSPLETNSIADKPDTIGAAKLHWKPHLQLNMIHFMIKTSEGSRKGSANLERLEKLALLCMHLQKFRSWIGLQIVRAWNNKYDLLPNAEEMLFHSTDARLALIHELKHLVSQTDAGIVAELITRILDNCIALTQGQVDSLELLQADNGLGKYYDFAESRTNSVKFFASAGHTNPTLRVLEIGAGTGSVTATALRGLTTSSGPECDRLYSLYTFTDISAGFFPAAQERFKEYQGLEFKMLDITKDPIEQGFEAKSYDLIIASNVLHATPIIHGTLVNVRKLLAPRGYLFLQELCPTIRATSLIMGILPGWWLGENDGRVDEPFMPSHKWEYALKRAGYSKAAEVFDGPRPYHINVNMVYRPAQLLPNIHRVTLLHNVGQDIEHLLDTLTIRGYQVDLSTLQDGPPPDQDIISVLVLEAPLFANVSHEDLIAFQRMVARQGNSKILWLIPAAQYEVSSSPEFGLTLGLARMLRAENSVSFATLESNWLKDRFGLLIVKIFEDLHSHDSQGSLDADSEFFIRNGTILVGRYYPASVAHDLAITASKPCTAKLAIGRPGLLQTLQWTPLTTREPEHGEVVIQPQLSIGLEGSGVVTEVGTGVTDLHIGDRVIYLNKNCFATRITISATKCAKIPQNISYEEAATLPAVYATVIHSLLDIGGLQSGQSVLIHSACGGIGIAALNICQSIGRVQVYTTVGNEEKARYLTEAFSIPRTPCGKMLEIGKEDIVGKAQLNMGLFEANRSFIGIDLNGLDTSKRHRLLVCTLQMLESGDIKPISPMTVFPAVQIEDSFRYMQKGAHMGKIIVTIPEGGQDLPLAATTPDLTLSADASYLLVGGMGGLGRAIATWLVERGARYLIFFSRSAGTSEQDLRFIEELECQSCSVQTIQGSVINKEDVMNITQVAKKPIKGVFQLSMVLQDKPFMEMDLSDWTAAIEPKVQGTWNLHHAMPEVLDFFFVAGSISGSLGLPASVLHIGLMDDIGYLAKNSDKADALRAADGYFLREMDLLDSLNWAIVKSAVDPMEDGSLTIGLRCDKPLSDPSNRIMWRKDPRMAVFHNIYNEAPANSSEADPETVLDGPVSVEVVTHELAVKIYTFMLQPLEDLDVGVSPAALGIDSLVTIEIRNWMKRCLGGIEISTLEILNAGSIANLGMLIIEALKKKFVSQIARAEGGA